jgi:hypothetical protein
MTPGLRKHHRCISLVFSEEIVHIIKFYGLPIIEIGEHLVKTVLNWHCIR